MGIGMLSTSVIEIRKGNPDPIFHKLSSTHAETLTTGDKEQDEKSVRHVKRRVIAGLRAPRNLAGECRQCRGQLRRCR